MYNYITMEHTPPTKPSEYSITYLLCNSELWDKIVIQDMGNITRCSVTWWNETNFFFTGITMTEIYNFHNIYPNNCIEYIGNNLYIIT